MTAANFPICLDTILLYEGGWSDNPKDPGGATMKGVTLDTYSHYLGRPATKDELRAITDGELEDIYRDGYWAPVKADDLPSGVDLMTFNASVNSGPGRGAKLLQQSVGVPQDGAVGPQTLAATNAQDPTLTINKYAEAHEAYYRSLSTFDDFGKGWMNRLNAIHQQALGMAT
jgi:lysozyme family protein